MNLLEKFVDSIVEGGPAVQEMTDETLIHATNEWEVDFGERLRNLPINKATARDLFIS